MKTELNRPAGRYHNEKVFRSAQQLIASRPPAPKRPRHWPVYVGILALGIGLGFFGRELWHRFRAGFADGATVSVSATSPQAVQKNSAPSVHAGESTPPPPSMGSADDSANPATSAPATPAARVTVSASPNKASASRQSQAAMKAALGPTVTLPVSSKVTWVGELLAPDSTPVSIEFVFSPVELLGSDPIHGLDRIGGVASNTVVGALKDRRLTLRETDTIWKMMNRVPADSPLLKTGREFVIQIPETQSAVLTGTWSLGTASGTLTLSAMQRL